ncbi:ComE1 [Neisseria gonorrhoeae]|uniref:ComE1 n=1 Tax=Neisseria gonorrhoeae TaxID=485 RepID=A0A378VVT8_NEIGO|nr:ComE1 [Neisseria gonorrhoeae]
MFVLFCMLFSCAFSLAAVNINAASQQELEALPGIGPAKAKAIAEYRAQNGAFKSVDDLIKVKGIGPAVLAKLKDQASVGAPAPKGPAKPVLPAVKNRVGNMHTAEWDSKSVQRNMLNNLFLLEVK